MHESSQPSGESIRRKAARNAGLSRLAQFIEKYKYNTNWTIMANMAGIGHILDSPKHERVRRAQSFGDSDYPEAVFKFLLEVFEVDEQVGFFLVSEIVKQENPHDPALTEDERNELNLIFEQFDSDTLDANLTSFTSMAAKKLIEPAWFPDDFYHRLINEINQSYAHQQPMSLSVLVRKLLENLVIDILRKKYSTSQLELYYVPSRGRFHDFSRLVKNLDAKKAEFRYITSSLDASFIKILDQYRGTGNAAAHSIDANLRIDQFDKDEITYIVELLLKVLRQI